MRFLSFGGREVLNVTDVAARNIVASSTANCFNVTTVEATYLLLLPQYSFHKTTFIQVIPGFRKVELELWARSHLTG